MIFPQQASNLLTSMRQCTKPLPTPAHSRMALGQVSIRPQPLHLLSVCLQNSLQINPVSLNDFPLGRWIIRRATGQKARHITPKCPTIGMCTCLYVCYVSVKVSGAITSHPSTKAVQSKHYSSSITQAQLTCFTKSWDQGYRPHVASRRSLHGESLSAAQHAHPSSHDGPSISPLQDPSQR